ncbi:D-alanyl-D-alanine carboxypeptidase family protein [Solilutibacter pythonis]|uniref:D-alanyl-D-alanine carboxypeptidase family protein n=1 Tax=Solilutibacter pythonis TaxID=2483112 RepID=UPI003CCC8205
MILALAPAMLATTFVGLAVAQPPAPAPAAVTSGALPTPPAPAPRVSTAWLLMDAASGEVLAGENVDEKREPASVTKVMTSYVIAAEMAKGNLKRDEPVMMTENAWRKGGAGTDGSYSGFEVNKAAPLIEMEKGMVVQSGNDAAIALAEHVAGSEQAFASLMNGHAQRIGMKNTHFANATGLSEPDHVSTARDLALLGRALARDFPEAYAFNSLKQFTVGPITQLNRNLLLWRDSSVDGIKTGHTSKAGFCLMASAKRGDQRLISVLLGGSSEEQRAVDSQALLNWGFRFFESHRLYDAGKVIATQKVWKGQAGEVGLGVAQPLVVSLPRGRYPQMKSSMDVPKTLVAPVAKGQRIGSVKVTLDGKVIATAPLVALEAVEQGGFFKRLWDEIRMWWASL